MSLCDYFKLFEEPHLLTFSSSLCKPRTLATHVTIPNSISPAKPAYSTWARRTLTVKNSISKPILEYKNQSHSLACLLAFCLMELSPVVDSNSRHLKNQLQQNDKSLYEKMNVASWTTSQPNSTVFMLHSVEIPGNPSTPSSTPSKTTTSLGIAGSSSQPTPTIGRQFSPVQKLTRRIRSCSQQSDASSSSRWSRNSCGANIKTR